MNDLTPVELAQVGLCDHRYNAAIVPHKDTFVLTIWCLRCGESSFTQYQEPEEQRVNLTTD